MPFGDRGQWPAGSFRQRPASLGREPSARFPLRRAAGVESVSLEADNDAPDDLGRDALSRSNVQYVHGSRSPSLAGVVRLGGLQSIQRLDAAYNLLGGGRLETGEQHCTLMALADNARGVSLPLQQQRDLSHVSVSSVRAWDLAWRDHARNTPDSLADGFPVLFGMDHIGVVAEHDPFYRHYFVQDFVPLSAISAVFTFPSDMDRAKATLRDAGAQFLADRVRPLIAQRSFTPPARRHSCPPIPDPDDFGEDMRNAEHEAMLCLLDLR